MRGDCGTWEGRRRAAVEYHSLRISLAPGILNDVFGTIKSSAARRGGIDQNSKDHLGCERNAAEVPPTDREGDR